MSLFPTLALFLASPIRATLSPSPLFRSDLSSARIFKLDVTFSSPVIIIIVLSLLFEFSSSSSWQSITSAQKPGMT